MQPASAQRYWEVVNNRIFIIGGNKINDKLLEISPIGRGWRYLVNIDGATRAFILFDISTACEEIKFFKCLEVPLESPGIAEWKVEALEVTQDKDREYLNFRFSSISAAHVVKDAMEGFGYDVVYNEDPCEGSVEELGDINGFKEFADI
ncbi:hypothetical protein RUND412_000025 [Rhizina undulata]